jgi:syntaxin-binding protein 1
MFKLIESKQGIDSPPIQHLLDELCHRLFTVCSVFMEYPWVQYQGTSPFAKSLAIKLNSYLNKFYTTQAKEKIKIKEPRGTLLICDRSIDLLSPVLHDFHYQSLVYEFKDVGDEGEVMVGEGK